MTWQFEENVSEKNLKYLQYNSIIQTKIVQLMGLMSEIVSINSALELKQAIKNSTKVTETIRNNLKDIAYILKIHEFSRI